MLKEINKKLLELLEKEVLTVEEMEQIEEHEQVERVENNGNSGRYASKMWYTAYLTNGEEFDIYI